MNIFNISIADRTPPTKKYLDELKNTLTQQGTFYEKFINYLNKLYFLIIFNTIIVIHVLQIFTIISTEIFSAITLTIVMLFFGTHNIHKHSDDYSLPISFTSVLVAFQIDSSINNSFPVISIIALVLILISYAKTKIIGRNQLNQKKITELLPLENKDRSDEYHHFLNMCERDLIVEEYYVNIKKENREPIGGEYYAAIKWVEKSQESSNTYMLSKIYEHI